jgi:hypothetical protein
MWFGLVLDPKLKSFVSTQNMFCTFMHFGLDLKSSFGIFAWD